jgi:hypothetical protein
MDARAPAPPPAPIHHVLADGVSRLLRWVVQQGRLWSDSTGHNDDGPRGECVHSKQWYPLHSGTLYTVVPSEQWFPLNRRGLDDVPPNPNPDFEQKLS